MLKSSPSSHIDPRHGEAAPAAWIVAALLACAAPVLIAFNAPPSSTFLNQACALGGWAAFLFFSAGSVTGHVPKTVRGMQAALVALALLGSTSLASPPLTGLPWSLAWSSVAMIAAAALTLTCAAATARRGAFWPAMTCLCMALVVAGAASMLIACVQVFAPQWADGNWIAATSLPGRAAGNLRQPNHLSSVMLWALIAVVWLGQTGRLPRTATWLLMLGFVGTVVLTASRTGTLGVGLLGVWAIADRSLSRRIRLLLLAMPVTYALWWFGLNAWPATGDAGPFVASRFSTEGDISSSRFSIWSDTVQLIRHHPWWGVGSGEFNFAWSLTPFPHRPVAFFDHTHNLPLQLMVELGLPLAGVILALLSFALWRAFQAARLAAEDQRAGLRSAFMLVLVMVLHSLLEYPLWYAYFLLPTAYALGLCLGGHVAAREGAAQPHGPVRSTRVAVEKPSRWLQTACILMLIVSGYSVFDYWKVVVIFSPGPGAATLAERIEDGKHSIFFAHHAHYAAATTSVHPSEAMFSAELASHYLLDTRLMMAWAQAYQEQGDLQRARHLADRLREFHNGASVEFLNVCKEPPVLGMALPFQCAPATQAMDYRDFRR